MARPQKEGLDYFPVDTDMCSDDKIYMLEVECDLEGVALFLKLLMKIYDNSYYIKWRDKDAKIFAHKNSVGVNVVNNFIQVCLDNELFDADIYNELGILTSRAIQERYFKAVARRKEVKYRPELILVDVNDYNNLVNVNNNSTEQNSQEDNGDDSTQSKVKESKGEESKADDDDDEDQETSSKSEFAEIQKYHFEALSSTMTGTQSDIIETYLSDGMEVGAIKQAYKRAGMVNANNFLYVQKILNDWINKDVLSEEKAKIAIEERGNNQQEDYKGLRHYKRG